VGSSASTTTGGPKFLRQQEKQVTDNQQKGSHQWNKARKQNTQGFWHASPKTRAPYWPPTVDVAGEKVLEASRRLAAGSSKAARKFMAASEKPAVERAKGVRWKPSRENRSGLGHRFWYRCPHWNSAAPACSRSD